MIQSTSQKETTQREEYERIRDEFHEKRNKLLIIVDEHESDIKTHQKKINELNSEIKQARPKIEGLDNMMACKNCDIYSMEYQGIVPGQGGRTHVYECVICGYEGRHS